MFKQKNGITLVVLMTTVVVLLILAGVSINFIFGNEGIFTKAQTAVEKYKNSQEEENILLAKTQNEISGIDGNRDTITISKDELISLIKEYSDPVGSITMFSYDSTEEQLSASRYLRCEGQEVSRTTYADLFAKIGTMYGEGDGSTTFNIPDLRGEFLRGTGTNSHSNQGSGDKVGNHQDGTIHAGVYSGNGANQIGIVKTPWSHVNQKNQSNSDSSVFSISEMNYVTGSNHTNGVNMNIYTSRPTNTSVLYCIKY